MLYFLDEERFLDDKDALQQKVIWRFDWRYLHPDILATLCF